MDAAFERIDNLPRSSWKFQVRSEPGFPFRWHFHDEYELTLITRGTGRRFVGDSVEPYDPGDLVLFGEDLPHAYVSDGEDGNEAVVLQFRRSFLGAELFDSPDFAPVGAMLARSRRGLAFAGGAAYEEDMRRLGTLDAPDRTLGLLAVLVDLARAEPPRPLAAEHYQPTLNVTARAQIQAVCQFLQEAYSRPVTLAETAAIAHLTPAAFSRFFQREMGRTLTAYLTDLRISAACRLLMSTDLPIATVAGRCGYGNLANFNRRFRALKQMAPREYRRAFVSE
ncbi:MAG TPA: AraC family transcriptional regulator [Mycobacteriales bacterium]|nr:AraC family transcriptional regulator [Mycobacteriales bacterium]